MCYLLLSFAAYAFEQKVYTSLVRLHDNYDMHETFLPGFPGLLEAFYVQEKIMQQMLPGIYAVFVGLSAFYLLWGTDKRM